MRTKWFVIFNPDNGKYLENMDNGSWEEHWTKDPTQAHGFFTEADAVDVLYAEEATEDNDGEWSGYEIVGEIEILEIRVQYVKD